MPTNHQAVTAFPVGASQANKSLARTLTVKRMAYVVNAASEVPDLVAVDPDTGDVIIVIICLGRCFLYDSADTTSAHDGTTVLVSNDNKRYKLASGTDVFAYSVLDNTLTAPPGSPTIGDAYLVATGGTGAWSGHDDQVAVYTVRGWEFVIFGTGRLIYVSAGTNIDTYYHRNAGGTWVRGFGSQSLGSNIVQASAIIGKPVRWIVENQTTNAPPGSPTIGDAYIIGSAPTGAWSGNAGKIAICEAGTSFTIYTPRDGELAYDKTQKLDYRFNTTSSAWLSAAGAIIGTPRSITTNSGSTTTGNIGTTYTYSDTTAPSTSQEYGEDSITITYTTHQSGTRLRFWYQFRPGNSVTDYACALFRDAEANAVDWVRMTSDANTRSQMTMFEVITGDSSAHTYKVRIIRIAGAGNVAAPTKRRFAVEEFE